MLQRLLNSYLVSVALLAAILIGGALLLFPQEKVSACPASKDAAQTEPNAPPDVVAIVSASDLATVANMHAKSLKRTLADAIRTKLPAGIPLPQEALDWRFGDKLTVVERPAEAGSGAANGVVLRAPMECSAVILTMRLTIRATLEIPFVTNKESLLLQLSEVVVSDVAVTAGLPGLGGQAGIDAAFLTTVLKALPNLPVLSLTKQFEVKDGLTLQLVSIAATNGNLLVKLRSSVAAGGDVAEPAYEALAARSSLWLRDKSLAPLLRKVLATKRPNGMTSKGAPDGPYQLDPLRITATPGSVSVDATVLRKSWPSGCVTALTNITPEKDGAGIAARVGEPKVRVSSAPGWLTGFLLPDEASMSKTLTKLMREEASAQLKMPTGLTLSADADAWAAAPAWVGLSFSILPSTQPQ